MTINTIKKYSTIGLWAIMLLAAKAGGTENDPIIWDAVGMKQVKASIASGDDKYAPALAGVVAKADKYLQEKPLSVMDKKLTAPSGDKHDFMTWAIYWWPDPNKPDGKPYIHKDGLTNPEVLTTTTDGGTGKLMFRGTPVLALAYYYTGNEKYAEKAAQILRIWYIDPETRMNPNLNYGEGIPGRCTGRWTGIITFSLRIHYILDSIAIIRKSKHWTEKDENSMRQWLQAYIKWLKSSKLATKAQNAGNNHGTWFAEHLAIMQYYLGNKQTAVETIKEAFSRLFSEQFNAAGAQLHELQRTRSLTYSEMNLRGWLNMCKIAELGGYDAWNYKDKIGASVKKGIEFMAPFATKNSKWAYKQIRKEHKIKVLEILQRGYNAYDEKLFLKAIEDLPHNKVRASEVQLKFPLK